MANKKLGNIPMFEKYIKNLFQFTNDDVYSVKVFDSKQITDEETGEIRESGAMKSIMIKGLVKNHTISFKLFENKDYVQIVKYNRETQKQNFINFNKDTDNADLLQLQSFVAQRNKSSEYSVEDFVA